MSELVADCPRCGTKQITFDLYHANSIGKQHRWKEFFEAFCVCRRCHRSTVFVLAVKRVDDAATINQNAIVSMRTGAVNNLLEIENIVSIKDFNAEPPPEYLLPKIEVVFSEAAKCLAIGCFNAAAAMYRLCLDMATYSLLPEDGVDGLNAKIRRSLGLRLEWLFNTNRLPEALKELSLCVKDDGNDGAHEGTLQKEDAEDIHDFTFTLLERLYTEPERLNQAKIRREERRKVSTQ